MRTALTLCLLTAAAFAQRTIVVEASADHGDIVTTSAGLTLPRGEFTVGEMLDATAGFLCRNYIYDPDLVANRETFRLQRPLSLDAVGCEEVLYALLAARDLAALPLDELRGVYQVVSIELGENVAMPMATLPWRRPQDILRRANLRELVMTVVTLENVDALQLADALRAHFSLQRSWRPGSPLVSASGPHSLILHGYGDQLAETILALRQIDRAAAPPQPVVDARILERLAALEQEVARLRRELAAKK